MSKFVCFEDTCEITLVTTWETKNGSDNDIKHSTTPHEVSKGNGNT